MNFLVNCCNLETEKHECVMVGFFKYGKFTNSANVLNFLSKGYISNLINTGDFIGEIGSVNILYNVPNVLSERVILIGCGKDRELTVNEYKKIVEKSIKSLENLNIVKVISCLTELSVCNQDIYWKIRIAIDVITNINYSFNRFKKNKKLKNNLFKKIIFNSSTEYELTIGREAVKHATAISMGVTIAKDLSNMPPNVCNPKYLSLKTKELSKKYCNNITIETMNSQQIKDAGMHAYLAVGKGSMHKSYMSIIHYKSISAINKKPIVLIGKGVTFDSGGISIKPSNYMNEMKYDMSGASAVYGAMLVAAELKLSLNIVGILACAENMPSGSAFRPGDILTTMSGKTVEILDTDAEGRLILCDVLTYVEKFNPELVIDVATLTGACVVALGKVTSGLLSNNDDLINDLLESGEKSNDKVWNFPMFPEYERELYSNVADVKNVGGNSAGVITAACFLSKFAKKYKWAHLDIAGTAWISGKYSQATGRPVSLLSQFLLKKSLTNMYF